LTRLERRELTCCGAQFVKLVKENNLGDKAVELLKSMVPEGASVAWTDGASSGEDADTESSEVKQLNVEISASESAKTNADTELRQARETSAMDFGPDQAFFPLKGQCFDFKQAQYTYQVCPFETAKQDHTSLGQFDGWEEGSGHRTMLFKNGQTCWNGPQRSLSLTFQCGPDDKVLSMDEPSKCAYAATMQTPAVCDLAHAESLRLELGDPAALSSHDEL
jgi:protein kinase C substrate 80K-H